MVSDSSGQLVDLNERVCESGGNLDLQQVAVSFQVFTWNFTHFNWLQQCMHTCATRLAHGTSILKHADLRAAGTWQHIRLYITFNIFQHCSTAHIINQPPLAVGYFRNLKPIGCSLRHPRQCARAQIPTWSVAEFYQQVAPCNWFRRDRYKDRKTDLQVSWAICWWYIAKCSNYI